MKAFKYIIIIANILQFSHRASSQTTKTDSVYWDNGNISVLYELDRVWIVQKKGGVIKGARIIEIKKEKGLLTYEKERCLHDISIGNISKIEPGKYPISYMYFQSDNTPHIKQIYKNLDQFVDPTDFKHISIQKNVPNVPAKESAPIKTSITAEVKSISRITCDTLIDEEGLVTPVKIILLEPRIINYKKINNPNGPIYVKPFSEAIITKHENSITINLYKNP